jgi:hypothetical protein
LTSTGIVAWVTARHLGGLLPGIGRFAARWPGPHRIADLPPPAGVRDQAA